MSKFEDATFPMKVAATPDEDAVPQPDPAKPVGRMMLPILGVSVLLIGMVCVGWGAWHYLHSKSNVDDTDSIAEMEGFEQASPTQGSQLKPAKNDSRRDRLVVPGPDNTASTSHQMMGLQGFPANMFPTDRSMTSAEVWLTGTIEEAESQEKIELPLRLSGEPNESRILR